jgi:hypothetical protein
MIILFSAGGRTGNQLFQVSHAMSARGAREWLLTFEFGRTRSLLSCASRDRWLNIESRPLKILIESLVYPFIYHALVRTGIVSHLHDRKNVYTLRRGKIRCVTIMKGYFESSTQHAKDLPGYFRLNGALRRRMRVVLDRLAGKRTPVFVHIRRTDREALSKRSDQLWRLLPDDYYWDAIRVLKVRLPEAFFVVVGDDPRHAEKIFADLEPKYISRLSVEEDMALMSLCGGGVLSCSTFAWWGAFFGAGKAGYIVPNFWAGFEEGFWHPPEIKAGFMTDFITINAR